MSVEVSNPASLVFLLDVFASRRVPLCWSMRHVLRRSGIQRAGVFYVWELGTGNNFPSASNSGSESERGLCTCRELNGGLVLLHPSYIDTLVAICDIVHHVAHRVARKVPIRLCTCPSFPLS